MDSNPKWNISLEIPDQQNISSGQKTIWIEF